MEDALTWNEIGVVAFGVFMCLGIFATYLVAVWNDLKRWLLQLKEKSNGGN